MADGYWLTFTPDSKHAFIAIRDADKVAMVDTRDKTVISHFDVGRAPARNLVVTLERGPSQ